MAPRAVVKESDSSVSGVLNEHDAETLDGGLVKRQEGYAGRRKIRLVWRNIILFAYLHLAAVYGLWLMLTSAQWKTGIFGELNDVVKAILWFSREHFCLQR
jgi:stearoyl-CoA desaturase (Delta-9 desaturase)